MALEIVRQLVNGIWKTEAAAAESGASLPDPTAIGQTPVATAALAYEPSDIFIRRYFVAAGQTVTAGQLLTIADEGILVVRAAEGGDSAIAGVALEDGAADEEIVVQIQGAVMLTASGTVTFGDFVKAASTGQAQTALIQQQPTQAVLITGGPAGDHVVAGVDVTSIVSFSVFRIAGGDGAVTEITGEFSVIFNGLNNTGGTNTTGDKLLVIFTNGGDVPNKWVARALSSAIDGQAFRARFV